MNHTSAVFTTFVVKKHKKLTQELILTIKIQSLLKI